MDTLADYTAWRTRKWQESTEAATAVLDATEGRPDEVAGDLNLANEFGKTTGNPVPPPPLVAEYRGLFQQAIEREKNRTILSGSPVLAEWLRNPENASVAKDDLSGLSWYETVLGAGKNAASRGIQRIPQSFNQFLANAAAERASDRDKTFGQLYADERSRPLFDFGYLGNSQMIDNAVGPITDAVFAGSRFIMSRMSAQFGIDENQAAVNFQQQVGAINKRIADIQMSPAGTVGRDNWTAVKPSGDLMTDLGAYMNVIAKDPGSFAAFISETAAESIPSLAATMVAYAVTRSPTVAATFAGIQSAATEKGSSPVDYFKEKGLDISTPEGAAAAISSPELMREAIKRGNARGVVIGLMDGLSMGLASQTLAKSHIGNMVIQSFAQAAMGAAGEAGGQIAAGQQISLGDILLEGLAEFASAPVEVAGMGGKRFFEGARNAKDAGDRVAFFEQLSGQAQNSILRGRLPEKFRQFVEAATANGPVENVYVPADQFVQYFQSNGIDPFALVDDLDGVTRDDLEAAVAGGGDLQIPTATYAAKIAGSEHDRFLMENMRFDPSQFTAREAMEFNAKAEAILQEAWEVSEQQRIDDESYRSHEQEIYDTMVSRLRAAGRSTDVATTEATLYPAFYRVMAERSGMAIDEFMQRYPLPQISGALPEGMQFRDVDALNRTLAEARARRSIKDTRQTLLEFISEHGGINDPGGELKARNAETISRGKGKKSLKLARSGILSGVRDMFAGSSGKKHGVDDVALAAVEAGYMANDPAVAAFKEASQSGKETPDITNALWSAIDRELRGDVQYSEKDATNPAFARAAELDQIEAYLSGLGVSLDDDDAKIKDAIQNAKQYAQSGGPGPRGVIQFPAGGIGNGETVIRLFETADLSTMLHESGHYFLTVMQDMAARGEAGASSDFEAVKAWWRENAEAVAADAMRVMPDVKVTAEDVIAALDNGTTGDVLKDGAIDVGMQEQWARGFETYLMEGNAPSIELRSAFEKFRAWLVSVYRRLAGLNVKVSDDIRRVFDRMIASDAEIAKAVQETGDTGPVFATAEQMGLTADQYAAFLKLRSQAQDEAKARLLRETMAPIKRQKEKWFKEERATVREEVEREVNAFRYYRAIEWMGNRRWIGEGQPEGMPDMRMSRDVLVDRYGEGVLKTLPRGKFTLYTNEGGIDPDEAAGWFGFGSGDEMIQAMEKAPPRKEAIDAETDRLMRERHGDVLNDGAIEAEALDAVHTDKRGQWIAAELKAVVEVAGTGNAMTAKEARATARQTVSRMRVRDAMNANRFLAAERKASEEAARLGAQLAREKIWLDAARRKIGTAARAALRGDGSVDAVADAIEANNAKFETTTSTFTVPAQERVSQSGRAFTIPGGERTTTSLGYNDLVAELIAAKRRQLLNHALYSEARKVADEVEKAERFVAKLGKKSHRERIAGAGRREGAVVDYLSAIDELLDQYDFRKMSGAAEQRRGALNAFVAAMKAAGRENELAIPDDVLIKAARAPYKTLPVDELRGVIDSLKNLEHMALRWDDLIDAQNKRKLDEVVTDILAAFDANVKKRPPGRVATRGEALRNAGRQFLDLVLNATTLLREIDGFKDGGAAYRNIKAPIDDAMSRLIERKQKAATDLEALYDVYSKDERRRMAVREHNPALGLSLSKWERIAVALNTGNAGNRQRLTDPNSRGALTDAQVDIILRTLDDRDANFVQSIWDYIGTFRDDIAARERRATGVEPQWVEASPVEVGGKMLRGGYYPIKYDPRLSSLARDDETQEIAQSLQAGRFGKAQTRNGHLKERAQSSGRAVELDMSVMHRHINQVIYDIELSEPVANAWRILQDKRVRASFMDSGKQPDFDALEIWLKDAAEGELRSADFIGRASRVLKSNFTAAKLAFNLSTVAMQITGVAQTSVVVGKRDMVNGIVAAMRPGAIADIVAKSEFMATRQTTFNKDIYDFYSDPKTGPVASRWGDIKKEIVGPLSFWLMTKVQWHAVDVASWLAGYQQGLRKFGNDEAKAIAHADDIVKRSQASGLFSDRSAIERGSVTRNARQNDVVRLFTTLGSYMFAKFNVAYERTATAKRTIHDEGVSAKSAQEALSWTLDMAFLFTLEAVVTAAIKGGLPSDDDDEEKDGWFKFLAKQTGLSVMGTLPLIRDGASSLQGFDGGGAYGSAMKDIGGTAVGVWNVVSSFFTGEDVKKADVKRIIAGTGLATGMPATQINRAVDAEWRRAEGEDVAPLEYLLGKFKK